MCSFDGVKEDEEKSGLYSADHLEMRGIFSWFPTQKRPENRTGFLCFTFCPHMI